MFRDHGLHANGGANDALLRLGDNAAAMPAAGGPQYANFAAFAAPDTLAFAPNLAFKLGDAGASGRAHHETSTYTTYTLTSGRDSLTCTTPYNLILGTFGYVTPGGAETGGTFSVGDYIDGGSGNSSTLSIYQNNPNPNQLIPFDVMPIGVTILNIQEFDVNSVQALGVATEYFDTRGVDNGGLAFLNIQAVLGSNFIEASSVTNVSVIDYGGLVVPGGATEAGDVNILGGHDINVSTTGVADAPPSVVTIGSSNTGSLDPTGTITVLDTDQTAGSDIITYGGTDVNATGYAAININNPTGNVSVSELGNQSADTVSVIGGANVNVVSAGGSVSVYNASGNVSVKDTLYGAAVTVDGGNNITVNAFGAVSVLDETGTVNITGTNVTELGGTNVTVNASGAVKIGQSIVPGPNNPSGTITVVDTGTNSPVTVYCGKAVNVTAAGAIGIYKLHGSGPVNVTETNQATVSGGITVYGGQAVTVNSPGGAFGNGIWSANSTTINVGVPIKIITRQDGTQYIAHLNEDPSGAITINNSTNFGGQVGYGAGAVAVTVLGSKIVSITGGTAAGITDAQSIALVRTPGGNPTPGVSTLATVVLDGVAGTETISSDALTSLTIKDSGAANTAGVLNTVVYDRTAGSLAVSLNNDAAGTALTDSTATGLAITLGTANSALAVTAQAEKTLSITGHAVLYLTGAAGQSHLQSITITGAAGLNDGGVATGLDNYAALAKIDGSNTSGALTVALNQTETFQGGSGLDTVTLSGDALASVNGGSGGNNVLVANGAAGLYTAANTGANVAGFSILRTTNLSSGTYDLRHVFNGITNVDVAQTPAGPLTFSNAGTVQTLSIEPSLGANAVTLALPSGYNGAASLALSLGTATSAGIDTSNGNGSSLGAQLLGAQGYTSVAVASNGGTNSVTGLSLGTNFVRLGDTSITTLTVTGAENLTIGSTGSLLGSIDTTGAAASATIDLRALGITIGGATLTDGAATVLFTGNAQGLKFDTVNFASANNAANQIVELGTGGLYVTGSLANGNNSIVSSAGVLDAALGNGNNTVTGSDATNTILLGNGNNTINLGKSAKGTLASTVTVGSGKNTINIIGNGNDAVFAGTLTTDGRTAGSATISVGNGRDQITAGAGHYAIQLGTGADTVTANVGATNAGGVTIAFSADSTASDTFTLGDGTNTIGASGVLSDGNNTVTTGNGSNTLVFGNGSNIITAGGGTDVITVGNGNNTIGVGNGNDLLTLLNGNNNVTLGNGNDHITVGSGANVVTIGSGTDTLTLAVPNAGIGTFTDLVGAIANDTIQFLATNGTGVFANGSAAGAEVLLPPNATFADYVNAACIGDGSTNSIFAWFDFNNSQYLVEDNSKAGAYVAGKDTILQLGNSTLNLPHMTLDPTGHNITFHL